MRGSDLHPVFYLALATSALAAGVLLLGEAGFF